MTNTRVAIKAIIEKDDKILILKRSSEEEVYTELWDIPGGKMEFGEKPLEAIKREVLEEANIEIEVGEPFAIWSFMARDDLQVVGITIIAKYISGEIKLSNEHTEFEWIDPKDFVKYNADKSLKAEIEKYSQKYS